MNFRVASREVKVGYSLNGSKVQLLTTHLTVSRRTTQAKTRCKITQLRMRL
jgi:hypothetical protein